MSDYSDKRQSPREEQERHLLGVYPRALDLEFRSGEGSWVTDSQGKRHLDLATGLGVNLFGHRHPRLQAAIERVLKEGWHCSNLFYSPYARELAARLCEQSGLQKAYFCNSGAEAIETAVKIARRFGHYERSGRHRIVCFQQGWHGRTYAAISACADASQQEGCGPLLPGFDPIPLFDSDALVETCSDETLAVLIEPILGHGGIRKGEPHFYETLQRICQDKGILLILDEIQTGCGRSGAFFAFKEFGLQPDIVTLAKGLGGGVPIGATLCNATCAQHMSIGSHGSTLGANPLSCSVALEVTTMLLEGDFMSRSAERMSEFAGMLRKALGGAYEVRQIGALFGISVPHSAKRLTHELAHVSGPATSLITTALGEQCLRLLPPLTFSHEEMSTACTALGRGFATLFHKD